MKINELFLKPIDRDIEGVIKADDMSHLKVEVEEYVLTNEIVIRLVDLLEQYNQAHTSKNGVWISGFFGSGKSHMLKILALLFEDRDLDGLSPFQTILSKVENDAFLSAELNKMHKIPSKSILFNIDQKSEQGNPDNNDLVLGVFNKVFDEFCGYYGKQGFVANFERELDQAGLYQAFKETYLSDTGKTWEVARETFNLNRKKIAAAYAKTTGNHQNSDDIIQSYREDYRPSIEDFANKVNNYILTQEAGFRLNFFVDEVGQYIAENIKLMTNLQSIAESLATICNGRSWIFVTSQDDMSKVFGGLSQRLENDFSKIQGRFHTKIKLNSQDVAFVIQKRLLEKTEDGKQEVANLYNQEYNNFGTLFDFPDKGGTVYKNFRDEAEFISSYPFVPYQYPLFQQSIETLSSHNAFTGKHSSVGERSMLGVFQEVVKKIATQPVGSLGSFDLMFEGIRAAFKAQIQSSILLAEQQLVDPFSVKLLKTLFLVKYVKGFKATKNNLRVLMQSSFDEDIQALENRVSQSLAELERQTYIQRNEDEYEYLTEEEHDIEAEIKTIQVDNDTIAKFLSEQFFGTILGANKINSSVNQQPYSFSYKVDNKNLGKDFELSINLISPWYEYSENLPLLKSHSLDLSELLVVLPPNQRFMDDISMSIKTETYIKQNHTNQNSETRSLILATKSTQNEQRKRSIRQQTSELVKQAVFIASGTEVEVQGDDPKSMVSIAFNKLLDKIYPHMRMLGSRIYSEKDLPAILEGRSSTLFMEDSANLSEAANEMLSFIRNNKTKADRSTMKVLVDHFGKRPYGWYQAAIQSLLAELLAKAKVELWQDKNLIEGKAQLSALTNTYNFANIEFQPVESVNPLLIKKLQAFLSDFFNQSSSENDFRRLQSSIRNEAQRLKQELVALEAQKNHYPFLASLNEPIDKLDQLAQLPDDAFRNNFIEEIDEWLNLRETQIDPILSFMSGQKKQIYDQIASFFTEKRLDLSPAQSAELQELLNNPRIVEGNLLQNAKQSMEEIRLDLSEKLENDRREALEKIEAKKAAFQQLPDFQKIDAAAQAGLIDRFSPILTYVHDADLAVGIRDRLAQFETSSYTEILNSLPRLISVQKPADASSQNEAASEAAKAVEYISLQNLSVPFQKYLLESEEDAIAYCQALQEKLLQAIRNNKNITL